MYCYPSSLVANDSDGYISNSDIVVQAKLIEFEDLKENLQIVTFEVLETYKGDEYKIVTIENHLHSSCSRVFLGKGSIYYIFAKLSGSNYKIEHGSFVSERQLREMNVEFNLKKSYTDQRVRLTHC